MEKNNGGQAFPGEVLNFDGGGFLLPGQFSGPVSPLNDSQQFTGLLDKSGKEIYEGDVVRGYYQRGATEDGYVQYDIDRFLVVGPGIRISEFATNVEVIGNVYENHELVKP